MSTIEKKSIMLEDMSWVDVKEYLSKNDVIFIPVGSIEQHGPHLPLDADVAAPLEVAKRVALQTGAVVAPPIRPGVSPHHLSFPGTIALKPSTLIALVRDYCESLHQHGFRKFILINGHGGNEATLRVALQEVHEHLPEDLIIAFSWWEFMPKELGSVVSFEEGFHANRFETSVMLAITPERVRMEKAVTEMPNVPKELAQVARGVYLSSVRRATEITTSGVIGDATKGKRQDGETYLKACSDAIAKAVEALIGVREKARREQSKESFN